MHSKIPSFARLIMEFASAHQCVGIGREHIVADGIKQLAGRSLAQFWQ
jgi:hypothetical protein